MAFPIPSVGDFQGWALTGILGILGAFGVWLRLNKTQTEITKTQTEGGWLTQLVKDRDAAIEREKETWTRYAKLKDDYERLKMQAILRDEKIARMSKRIDMLSDIVLEFRPELKAFLQNSGYGDIDTIPEAEKKTTSQIQLRKQVGENDA